MAVGVLMLGVGLPPGAPVLATDFSTASGIGGETVGTGWVPVATVVEEGGVVVVAVGLVGAAVVVVVAALLLTSFLLSPELEILNFWKNRRIEEDFFLSPFLPLFPFSSSFGHS
jgi:hypothetical protein